jgi:hypothetical protein
VAQLSFQPYELLRVRPRDVARGRPEERLAAAKATLPAGPRDVARGDLPKWPADLGHAMLALGADGRWIWLESAKLVQEGSASGKGLSLRRNFLPVAFLAPAQISRQGGVLGVSSQGRLLNLGNLMPVGTSLQPPETPMALELKAGESLLACLEVKL